MNFFMVFFRWVRLSPFLFLEHLVALVAAAQDVGDKVENLIFYDDNAG